MEVLFLRPFKTIKEQLRIIYNRGVQIRSYSDYKKAKNYLVTNNYYDLMNGYGRYFWKNTNKFYGTTFDEIVYLYEFDKAIRSDFLEATLIAEKHIGSIIAYYTSELCHHLGNQEAYLHASFFTGNTTYLRHRFQTIIHKYQRKRGNNPIKNHSTNHGGVPFWVIVNYLTFFELYTVLEKLPSIQNKVALAVQSFMVEHMELTTPFTARELIPFIYNVYEVRNQCGHNGRLLEFKCKNNLRYYPPLHDRFHIAPTAQKQDIYNTFLAIQCFLSANEYAQLNNAIRKRMNYLENKLKTIDISKIQDTLGFPHHWNRLPQAKQHPISNP